MVIERMEIFIRNEVRLAEWLMMFDSTAELSLGVVNKSIFRLVTFEV